MYILYTTNIKALRFISGEILGSVKNKGKLRSSGKMVQVCMIPSPTAKGRNAAAQRDWATGIAGFVLLMRRK